MRDPCQSKWSSGKWSQLWSQTVVHLPPGDLGRLRPHSDRVGCRSAGSGAYLIRPARADGPKSSAHSHAELGSLSSSSLLSPCRAECRQGVELQAHGWRSISATAKNEFNITRVEHRGFEPRTPCLPGKCSPAELMPLGTVDCNGLAWTWTNQARGRPR